MRCDALAHSRRRVVYNFSMKKSPISPPHLHTVDAKLDRRLFDLDSAQTTAFLKALDEPAPPNAKLKKLMAGKAPWEK